MSHCLYCPIEAGKSCVGEHAPRLCDRINPGHSAYRPEYRESIIETARQIEEQVTFPRAEYLDRLPPLGGCCGGG